ncbi:uncharacterized protein [Vicugna pacos]|uniref:Uncharacterized protein n=1 Tax=Vicugna pacos TaxID=30538 RepID=A0ABM5CHA1_VICPA
MGANLPGTRCPTANAAGATGASPREQRSPKHGLWPPRTLDCALQKTTVRRSNRQAADGGAPRRGLLSESSEPAQVSTSREPTNTPQYDSSSRGHSHTLDTSGDVGHADVRRSCLYSRTPGLTASPVTSPEHAALAGRRGTRRHQCESLGEGWGDGHGASVRSHIQIEGTRGPSTLTHPLHLASPGVPTCPCHGHQAGSQSQSGLAGSSHSGTCRPLLRAATGKFSGDNAGLFPETLGHFTRLSGHRAVLFSRVHTTKPPPLLAQRQGSQHPARRLLFCPKASPHSNGVTGHTRGRVSSASQALSPDLQAQLRAGGVGASHSAGHPGTVQAARGAGGPGGGSAQPSKDRRLCLQGQHHKGPWTLADTPQDGARAPLVTIDNLPLQQSERADSQVPQPAEAGTRTTRPESRKRCGRRAPGQQG